MPENDSTRAIESPEKDSPAKTEKAPKKIGVYLCRCGGNIGDVVDLQAVAESLKGENVTVNIQDYLCSSAGQEKIKNDIERGKVDRVVVGSCSPKLHLETFRGMAKSAGINTN